MDFTLPVTLVTHASDVYCTELQKFGDMDRQTAITIETIWQDIMKKVLRLSACARHVSAVKSGHYIHLTDFELVYEAVMSL